MASRVQFMRACWQRGEIAPWGVAGRRGDRGRVGETGQGCETGGCGETGARGEPRSISSSPHPRRDACAVRKPR